MPMPNIQKNRSYVKHGMTNTPEYRAWQEMIQRCYNPNGNRYHRYGGRGITVCARWLESFENFYKDMGDRPSIRHSLDRKDNDLGYYKENCRWATPGQQAYNKTHKKNSTGRVVGVALGNKEWMAYAKKDGKRVYLYHGQDFFEACCARKSWELHHAPT